MTFCKLFGALLGGALLGQAQPVFTTYAGLGQITTGVGPSVALKFQNLRAIVADPNDGTGSVFFADANRLLRASNDGTTSVFAGGGPVAVGGSDVATNSTVSAIEVTQ